MLQYVGLQVRGADLLIWCGGGAVITEGSCHQVPINALSNVTSMRA